MIRPELTISWRVLFVTRWGRAWRGGLTDTPHCVPGQQEPGFAIGRRNIRPYWCQANTSDRCDVDVRCAVATVERVGKQRPRLFAVSARVWKGILPEG